MMQLSLFPELQSVLPVAKQWLIILIIVMLLPDQFSYTLQHDNWKYYTVGIMYTFQNIVI